MKKVDLEITKLGNEHKLLSILPLELWREVDGFTDAKSHTSLRASCSFFRTWLSWEKDVEFEVYKGLYEELGNNTWIHGNVFQAAVRLDPCTMKQEHYNYLCMQHLRHEVFRTCRFALQEPFNCTRIDFSAQDNWAIRMASEKGHLGVVQLLLQDPRVDPSAKENQAFISASQNGHLAIVELLLQDSRVDPSAKQNEAFKSALNYGNLDVFQLILRDSRVDPASCDNYAIIVASRFGKVAFVEWLLQDPRVDPSAQDNFAISRASYNGHVAIVELLLQDPRVDPTACGNEALRNAATATSNSKQVCILLLSDSRVLAAYRLDSFCLPKGVEVPPPLTPPFNTFPAGRNNADRRAYDN